jgi:hypothetical protein
LARDFEAGATLRVVRGHLDAFDSAVGNYFKLKTVGR